MNYSLNVKSSSIVHTLLSNCVKLLGKVQKLLIKCISYSVISKRIRVVSPKFYTARKNFTGPPVPTVPTNFKSGPGKSGAIPPGKGTTCPSLCTPSPPSAEVERQVLEGRTLWHSKERFPLCRSLHRCALPENLVP